MLDFFTDVLWHAVRSSPSSNLSLNFDHYVKTLSITLTLTITITGQCCLLDSYSLS